MRRDHLVRIAGMILATTQIQAACSYSPPPLLSHGQGADTLGTGNLAVSGELGWGGAGSWYKAKNAGNPDVNTGFVGAGRARVGVSENVDVGLVGGVGPENAFVVGPEMKWRFAHLVSSEAPGAPGFHAAIVSGAGIGAADYRYGPLPRRHPFVAPYTGILVSGGIDAVQLFSGLRLAASETLGNGRTDLTVYPVLAFGTKVNASRRFALYAEGDLAGGVTATDVSDSSILGFACVGTIVTFDGLWSPRPAEAATPR